MTVVVVIAQGEMGAGIGQRLHERGARVLTSLQGRSRASAERAARAGMAAVEDDARLVAEADFILSIVPPGEAVALAQRLAPALAASARKPVFVDGNAISPARAAEVAATIAPTGAAFVDGGIIGASPRPGEGAGPRLYVSGAAAARVAALRDHGLDIRVMTGEIGRASALKLAYASLTKGVVAVGASVMLGAMRAGVAAELHAELAASQAALDHRMAREVPRMYPKAYRWVAEMEEIADFLAADPGAGALYLGAARLYRQIADDPATVALLDRFIGG